MQLVGVPAVGTWHGLGRLSMTFGPESVELARALRHAEDDLARQEHEATYIFRSDGTLVYHGTGQRYTVALPRDAIRGNIVVHNHPDGGSLSRRDVQVLLENQALQTRVVTSTWTYILDLPVSTAWDEVQELVTILLDQVDERHRDLLLAAELTYEEAERERWHEIWTGVAEIRGWAYRRQPKGTG